MASRVKEMFLEQDLEYLQDPSSRDELPPPPLQTQERAWKLPEDQAGLPRGEKDFLYKSGMYPDMDEEDKDSLEHDLQGRKMFLDEYPRVKVELEERIQKLRALADTVEKVHKDCTISNVVADSTGAASGILTILGFALAPVTAGVSLALSATGIGLGTMAAVTRISTSIVDSKTQSAAEKEASSLVQIGKDVEKPKKSTGKATPKLLLRSKNFMKDVYRLDKNIRAIQLVKANPRLAANARRLMTTGKISARNAKQVEKAFGGTALAMTKGARIAGAVAAGVFLLMDVISLAKESIHLHEGAKVKSAAELRQQAEELEKKLQELIQIHDALQLA